MFVYKKINITYNKEIRAALQNIFGIGWYKSILISSKLGFFYPFYVSNLNLYNWLLLVYVLDYFSWLEVRIRRNIEQNIKRHFDINSYIGIRHKDRLPVRGQRTRTNASTKKRYKLITND